MTRPSNDSIAQAFWEWVNKNGFTSYSNGAAGVIEQNAHEIDAAKPACPSCGPDGVYATDGTGPWDCYRCGKTATKQCAKSDKPEVSGSAHSELVLVPREPTQEMIEAGCGEHECEQRDPWYSDQPLSDTDAVSIYKAMIGAAPAPQKQEAVGEVVEAGPFKAISWLGGPGLPPAGTKLYTAQPVPTTDDVRDAERLRQFEKWANEGLCPSLVFDDNGKWAVAFDGNAPALGDGHCINVIALDVYVDPRAWQGSVGKAIDAAIREAEKTKRTEALKELAEQAQALGMGYEERSEASGESDG